MKIYFVIGFLVCFTISFGQVKEFGQSNGIDWKEIYNDAEKRYSNVSWENKKQLIDNEARHIKFYYMLGIFDLATKIPADNYIKFTDDNGKEHFYEIPHPFPYLTGTTPGQMIDALDIFYDDYRNMNVLILDAIQIANMAITGKSPKEIEWQTRYYRTDDNTKAEMTKERYIFDKKLNKYIDKLKETD